MPEIRIDGQLQSLYPTVPQTDIAKGEGANGEKVETHWKLVEPVSAGGVQVSVAKKFEKFSGVAALFGGFGPGSHFKVAHGGAGVGVEKSFMDNAAWSVAALAGYRGTFILEADGTTNGPFVSLELSGRGFFHPNLALVGGMGIYAAGLERLEKFFAIGLRWTIGNNGNGGNSK